MCGSYPHAGEDTAEVHCVEHHGYLKVKSALMIFDRFANLRCKFWNRHFWAKGYYVSTVGMNETTVQKYIREQEPTNNVIDKVDVKELEGPFRGS